jgi:hypothetical protein
VKSARLIFAIIFAFSCTHLFEEAAMAAAAEKPKTVMEQGTEVYNAMKTAARMFAVMKVGANEKDGKFLDSLSAQFKDFAIPKATLKDESIFLEGLESPMRGIDPLQGTFYYNGTKVKIDPKAGIEGSMTQLEKVFTPKKVSILDWFLPSANAVSTTMSNIMLLGAGALGLYGIMNLFSCFGGGSGGGSGLGGGGCMMGILSTGAAALLAYFGWKSDDPPTSIACAPAGGPMTIYGANGPLGVIGSNGVTSVAARQVPTAVGAQIYSICGNPAMYSGMNTALATPMYLPPNYQTVRPPFGIPMSVTPNTGKVGFRPASTPPGKRTPSSSMQPATLQPQGGASR